MRRDTALSLINDALPRAYDEDALLKLVHNLFGKVEVRDRERKGILIYDGFDDHVASYTDLIKYTDPYGEELNVLGVKLKSGRRLDRARTMQRNFAAEYLRRNKLPPIPDERARLYKRLTLHHSDSTASAITIWFLLAAAVSSGRTRFQEEPVLLQAVREMQCVDRRLQERIRLPDVRVTDDGYDLEGDLSFPEEDWR